MDKQPIRDPYKLVGSHLDRYVLGELVGVGGMGAVYRARHEVIENIVAVKVLKPDLAIENPDLVDFFIEEAQKTALLIHPSITRMFDANTTGEGLSYLVMEWLEGHTLAFELEEKKTLSINQITDF